MSLSEAEKLAVTGEKISRLSQEEKFLWTIEKKSLLHYFVILTIQTFLKAKNNIMQVWKVWNQN